MLIETKHHTHVIDNGSDSAINHRRDALCGRGTVGAFGTDTTQIVAWTKKTGFGMYLPY